MKWINHSIIAGSVCAIFSPPHVAACVLGATAPDWLEWISKTLGRPIKHRSSTHVLTHWLVLAIFATFIWDYYGLLTAFAWGGVSHILTDAMTVTGVPFSPYSDRRFHLFGGRFRTGDPSEYAIAAVFVVCSLGVTSIIGTGKGFQPFFPDWAKRYEAGLADAKEWKDNRWRLF